MRWRDLLDHLKIPYSDSSRYASRGWVAIHCVWCGSADPSTHLGINEEHGHYHCLRNDNHRGRSPYYLLHSLGVPPGETEALILAFGGTLNRNPEHDTAPPPRPAEPLARRWDFLTPAAADDAALAYLAGRNFPEPLRTAREFDLRVGRGKWGGRIWFKLADLAGNVVGFTGRAMSPRLEPRYYTEVAQPVLYIPKPPTRAQRIGIFVEGPFDALRLADAARRRQNVFVAALCGLSITGSKRLQLGEIARSVPQFAIALDSSVWSTDAQRLIAEVRAVPLVSRVARLPLPPDEDDPGGMSNAAVDRWLSTALAGRM
jgi:hypothetical protein